MEADTLINARWVIPIEPADCVLERHSIALRQGRIVALLPTEEAVRRVSAREVIERPTHVLLPGLVNACADVGAPSLAPRPGPADPWVDPERVRAMVELALARMLANGTTTFASTSLYPEVVARTAANIHLRTCLGLPVLEYPTSWAGTLDDYLDKSEGLHDEYRDDPLIATAFATGDPSSTSEAALQRLRRAADEIELPILVPFRVPAGTSGSPADFTRALLSRLDNLGLATPQLVGLGAEDLAAGLDTVLRTGMHVIACPRSQLRHGGSTCPAELAARGVNLGLGTGDHPGLDLQGEMQLASLLVPHASSGLVLSPHQALRMATLGGARAMGLADLTGSLVPGKWADLCSIDLATLRTQPFKDVAACVAQLAGIDQVADVWVAGRALLQAGSFVRLDPAALVERASRWMT